MEHPGGAQKGVKIKLIPIFLSSSFRGVVITLEYKNGSWTNWIYNIYMHMEYPVGGFSRRVTPTANMPRPDPCVSRI